MKANLKLEIGGFTTTKFVHFLMSRRVEDHRKQSRVFQAALVGVNQRAAYRDIQA
jgi:hypothetical protein